MATNDIAFFYDSVSGDRTYSADSFSNWLKKFFTTGVFNGDLQVKAYDGMRVNVSAGYCNIGGKVRIFDNLTTITLDAANGQYPRIDTIVLERNDTDRNITIEYVAGQYAGTTPEPTAPVRENNVYQLVLAQIYVGAGVTEILNSNITDTRPDTDLCGWVVGTVDAIDVEQLTNQAEAEFREWLADSESDFYTWFATIQDVLDEETAGHLQNEITAQQGLEVSVTLASTGWTAEDLKTIQNLNIDATKEITLTYPSTLTDEQFEELNNANIRPYGAVTTGSLTLKAANGAPEIDIPITLIIKG